MVIFIFKSFKFFKSENCCPVFCLVVRCRSQILSVFLENISLAIANDNPWEFQHKVRFGQPGSTMPVAISGGATNQDVADLGAAPGINRLVVVADAAEIAVRARQQAQPQVLGDVAVLVFVHQDIAELALIARQHVGRGAEDFQVVQQKIAEAEAVLVVETVTVPTYKAYASDRLLGCTLLNAVTPDASWQDKSPASALLPLTFPKPAVRLVIGVPQGTEEERIAFLKSIADAINKVTQ